MKSKTKLWLKFYGRPLLRVALMAMMSVVWAMSMASLLAGGDWTYLAAMFFSSLLIAVYGYQLRSWHRDYRRWKFQSYGRGSHNSV